MGLPKDSGLKLFAKWPSGPKNLITDVPGVRVGQVTLKDEERDIHTGVTAVLPHGGDIFHDKVMAASAVINGFGKSTGLVQIEELGSLETPIILTNTFSVGTAYAALTEYMLEKNSDIGRETGTVNCVITECNDGRVNDIRGMHVKREHVRKALSEATEAFSEGCTGAGTGMVCLGLKGGIGSASKVLSIDGESYTIGALVMSNFGSAGNLVIGGRHYDTSVYSNKFSPETKTHDSGGDSKGCVNWAESTSGEADSSEKKSFGPEERAKHFKDTGSIIIIIATDIPLNERQLKRTAKRAMIALGRVGSYSGNGSGDIALAFTTANRLSHYSDKNILETRMFYDENIDLVFEAAVEAVEEAIISSLYHAETTCGIDGSYYMGLRDFVRKYGDGLGDKVLS